MLNRYLLGVTYANVTRRQLKAGSSNSFNSLHIMASNSKGRASDKKALWRVWLKSCEVSTYLTQVWIVIESSLAPNAKGVHPTGKTSVRQTARGQIVTEKCNRKIVRYTLIPDSFVATPTPSGYNWQSESSTNPTDSTSKEMIGVVREEKIRGMRKAFSTMKRIGYVSWLDWVNQLVVTWIEKGYLKWASQDRFYYLENSMLYKESTVQTDIIPSSKGGLKYVAGNTSSSEDEDGTCCKEYREKLHESRAAKGEAPPYLTGGSYPPVQYPKLNFQPHYSHTPTQTPRRTQSLPPDLRRSSHEQTQREAEVSEDGYVTAKEPENMHSEASRHPRRSSHHTEERSRHSNRQHSDEDSIIGPESDVLVTSAKRQRGKDHSSPRTAKPHAESDPGERRSGRQRTRDRYPDADRDSDTDDEDATQDTRHPTHISSLKSGVPRRRTAKPVSSRHSEWRSPWYPHTDGGSTSNYTDTSSDSSGSRRSLYDNPQSRSKSHSTSRGGTSGKGREDPGAESDGFTTTGIKETTTTTSHKIREKRKNR
jgi:hypothetical protein